MAHLKTIQAIRIVLGQQLSSLPAGLGLYTTTNDTGGQTEIGSPTITFGVGSGDGNKFWVGQKVRVLNGFPSSSIFYFVISTTADTITLSENATLAIENCYIESETELRWSENTLSGTILSWTSGIIAKNGIGAIKESANFELGGAPIQYGGLTVMAINTNQLILRLKELGVKFPGLNCTLFEFKGTEADSDSDSITTLFTGNCEDIVWDETILEISIKNNLYKRRAQMGTVINNCPAATGGNYPLAADSLNGQIVPITLGTFLPDEVNSSENLLAKFIRTSEEETVLANDSGTGYCDPLGANIFPVVGYADTVSEAHLAYLIQFGTETHDGFELDLSEKYIKIVAGGFIDASSAKDKYRKIVKVVDTFGNATLGSPTITDIADTSDFVVGTKLYIEDYFGCSGSGTSYFERTLISKTASTITLDSNATDTGATNIYQGAVQIPAAAGQDHTYAVCLDSFFEKDLEANVAAADVNNAWVKISEIPFIFQSDIWPCKGFLDAAGTVITQNALLYSFFLKETDRFKTKFTFDEDTGIYTPYDEPIPEGFLRIPEYGYSIVNASPNNSLEIDIKLFKQDPSKMASFSIFPVENFEKYIAADLSKFSLPTRVVLEDNIYNYRIPPNNNAPVVTKNDTYGSGADVIDRDDSTFFRQNANLFEPQFQVYDIWFAYMFNLPKTKITIEYDSFYFGIKFKSYSPFVVSVKENRLLWERFLGPTYNPFVTMGQKFNDSLNWSTIDDLPDFYYLNRALLDNNKAFYFQIDSSGSDLTNISGYNLFKITDINNRADLLSINKLYFLTASGNSDGVTNMERDIYIYELALICEKTFDLGSELYSIFAGRLYNDTWESRFTATDIMQDPIAWMEHACRLQNWGEVGDIKLYGKEYSPHANINIDAVVGLGSFHADNTTLDVIRALRPAYQIHEEKDGWTDAFKKRLCEQYFLCSRQNNLGEECVHYLLTDEDPATTITMADIVGDVGETIEPKCENVFVEPYFRYCYNQGTKDYDRELRVLNAADAAWGAYTEGSGWHAEYTPGFSGTDGQAIWEACHVLWNRMRSIESPPDNMATSKMVVLYADAKKFMTDWVSWMGKRRTSFSVPYSMGRDWHVAKHIMINLPHRTNANAIECVIEAIEKDKNAGVCKLDIILLDDIPTAFFLA